MKKAAGIIGLILAIGFVVLGFTTSVPDKYIKSYGSNKMTEYVGGDAYNFIIEASLRGGEISGALISKAIYFAVAAVLAVISLSFLGSSDFEAIRGDLSGIKKELSDSNKNIRDLQDEMDNTVNKGIQTQTADIILALTNELSTKKDKSPVYDDANNTVEHEIAKQINTPRET